MNNGIAQINNGTWALYAVGVVNLGLGLMFVVGVIQMRRTLGVVAGRRHGQTAGALFGLGLGIIALRAATDRIESAALPVQVAAFAAVLVLVLVLATLGAEFVTNLIRRSEPIVERVAPVMELESGQRAVWSSTLSSKWMLIPALGILLFGPLFMFVPEASPAILAAIVIAGVALLSLASIRVRADSAGLHVNYGVLPWPTTSIAMDRIDQASIIDVRPMEWGGWGYRGTLKLMKQAAVVLRAGPGIRLDLTDGRIFVVTIDDPEDAVALLNAHAE
ncbi:MAG: hypothetical protein ACI81L_002198 [Verrucomicrobiales bacterium]|jgi:hypothetical protein